MSKSSVVLALSLALLLLFTTALPSAAFPRYHRVTIYGDSFAAGLYASDEAHTWRALLLADLQPDSSVLLGSSGRLMVAPDAVDIATNDVNTRNPDLILLEFGLNDVFKRTDPALFESATRALFAVYRGRKVMISGIPWWGAAIGKPGDPAYDHTVKLDAILRRVSAEFAYTFVDLFPATLNRYEYLSSPHDPTPWPPYHGDGLHYGDTGHAALYQLYRASILPVVWLPLISFR